MQQSKQGDRIFSAILVFRDLVNKDPCFSLNIISFSEFVWEIIFFVHDYNWYYQKAKLSNYSQFWKSLHWFGKFFFQITLLMMVKFLENTAQCYGSPMSSKTISVELSCPNSRIFKQNNRTPGETRSGKSLDADIVATWMDGWRKVPQCFSRVDVMSKSCSVFYSSVQLGSTQLRRHRHS